MSAILRIIFLRGRIKILASLLFSKAINLLSCSLSFSSVKLSFNILFTLLTTDSNEPSSLLKLYVLKKALPYALKEKNRFILYCILNIMICILGAIVPLLTATQLIKLTDGLFQELLLISSLILGIQLFMNSLSYFARLNAHKFIHSILKNLQIDLANEVLKIETKVLDKHSSGVFIDRLTQDTTRIADIFIELNYSLLDIITNIGLLVAIFVINKIMFLYYVFAISLVFFIERIRIKKSIEIDKKFRKLAENATGLIGELVRGVRDIKVLNAQDSFMNKINTEITNVNKERYKKTSINRKYIFIANSVDDLLECLLIVLGVFLISIKELSIESFVVIYMYRYKVFGLLYMISGLLNHYKDFELSANRVFDVIDSNDFSKEIFGKKKLRKIKGDFEFRNVSFSYLNKVDNISNVSFNFELFSFNKKSL